MNAFKVAVQGDEAVVIGCSKVNGIRRDVVRGCFVQQCRDFRQKVNECRVEVPRGLSASFST